MDASAKPSRVLVVADEPTLLRALEALLRDGGADVEIVTATGPLTVDAALAALETCGPASASTAYAIAKEQALRRFEKAYVDAIMTACDGNISAAARKAGMDRSNFKRILRKCRGETVAATRAGADVAA